MSYLSYCSCCGAPRGLSAHQHAYSLHDILQINEHRPIQRHPGHMMEMSPQLIVHVGVWRNGGAGVKGSEHICNDCLLVGIRHALERLQQLMPKTLPVDIVVSPAMLEAGASAAREYFEKTGGNDPAVIYRAMHAVALQEGSAK